MNTLLLAGLVANAIVNLRIAVLHVQDGTDRQKAGEGGDHTVTTWDDWGIFMVVAWTVFAPLITVGFLTYYASRIAYRVGKRALFPRGVKSKFARQQEAEAAAKAKKREHEQALWVLEIWNPGEFLLPPAPKAAPEPTPAALGWEQAADEFDYACELIVRTAGLPWNHPTPPRKRTPRARPQEVAVTVDDLNRQLVQWAS